MKLWIYLELFFDIDFPDRNKDPEDGADFLH